MRANLCAVLTLVLFGACGTAATWSTPMTLTPSQVATHTPGSIRVMTFNIQSGSHGLPAVAAAIREADPDLVALQEVDRGTDRSKGLDQAKELAVQTGLLHHVHFRATDLHGGAYGVALLSRVPLESFEHQPLRVTQALEPRTIAHAVVKLEGHEVSFYVTHLTHMPNQGALRVEQIKQILGLMEADPRPKVLLGDLNDGEDSEAVALLANALTDAFAQKGEGPPGTYPLPAFLPELRIDYVFSSPQLAPIRSFVLRREASDHYPLVADLALPAELPETASAPLPNRPGG